MGSRTIGKKIMEKKKKRKKSPYEKAKKKAWTVFSRYVRLRDCIRTTETIERCICCSCGGIIEMGGSLHAGHFIDGRNNAILFEEKAVHGQCGVCNRFRQGQKVEYFIFMEKKYGRELIDQLRIQAKQPRKYLLFDLEEMIEKWQEKIKYMETNKQLHPKDLEN